ncbi:hypothetical protein [Clostridium chromiireducens]|uniref:Uncharacterized protein n=1 Tax=Clostridium chromiireducens TaxID=225345 RepID=A0A1V4IUG8_9CLOT|nr:hypothetical protein [Clostridium chromiireducens]OPJ63688.1 hypothetical protein CLCHR_15030 [Clostridium chromiireducens]
MTPSILQDALVADLKEQLKEFRLKNSKNESGKLNMYSQNLPSIQGQKDSEYFPYLVIRVMDGENKNDEGEEKDSCKLYFIIGIYDDSDDNQGYKDLMNIIEKIKYRLKTKKYFNNNQFELELPLKWAIHEEDTFPHYFGGIETNWNIPNIQFDDSLI